MKNDGVNIHIATPESDKMLAVHDKSQAIGEFMEWLQGERGIVLAEWEDRTSRDAVLHPSHPGINQLLAQYFEIDLNVVEREKRAILAGIQASYAATDKSG